MCSEEIMKKLLSVFIVVAFVNFACPAIIIYTNIGNSTNIVLSDTNLPGIYSFPHVTATRKAQATNGSRFENAVKWGQFNYGTVMSGSRSNESGWMFFSLDDANTVKTGGGALVNDPWRSWKYEPGNRKFNIPNGTWVKSETNINEWQFITVLSGRRSNETGYFWSNLFTAAVSANSNQVYAGAVRTAPVMPFVGPSLGKKFFIPGGTSFTVASNTSEWYYVSRADFTNGYITNANFSALIFTNFYTNYVTNTYPYIVITNPAAEAVIDGTTVWTGTNSTGTGTLVGRWYVTNDGPYLPISGTGNSWSVSINTTNIVDGEFVFKVVISNSAGLGWIHTITNYITNS